MECGENAIRGRQVPNHDLWPGADIVIKGNPDFIGAMVCKSFYGNGNVSWHYDRALNSIGEVLDYRIASYVEDTR